MSHFARVPREPPVLLRDHNKTHNTMNTTATHDTDAPTWQQQEKFDVSEVSEALAGSTQACIEASRPSEI